MSVPRLGQKLSLISKSSIKYEGTLSEINAQANTLTLGNVTMLGTEDRPAVTFVPKADQLFQYIVFRGSDIEGLTVDNNSSNYPPADPAIVTAGPPMDAQKQQRQQQQHYNERGGYRQEKERVFPVHEQGNYHEGGGGGKNYNNYRGGGGGGGGNYRNNRRGGGGGGGGGGKYYGGGRNNFASHTGLEFAKPSAGKEEMQEFDFAAMQKQVADFEKEKNQTVNPVYKKEAGFFDSLTKDSDNKGPMKNFDQDTFGAEGARSGRGGSRGGRGRGGR